SSDEASSDEESSDEASSDEASEASDEASSEQDDEPHEATAEAAGEVAEAPKKKAKVGKDGKTAGARLAAAKAAKAARKAAKRGKVVKEEDPLERAKASAVGQRASAAGQWAKENRNIVLGAVLALLLGLAGFLGYDAYQSSQASAAAALLTEAIEISEATIRAEGEDAPAGQSDDDDERTYPTEEARTRAALEAFRRVTADYPTSEAAAWARLGEGRSHAALGQNDEARQAFEQAIAAGGSQPQIAFEALEGIGFSYEAEEGWDQAQTRYEEMRSLADGAYAPMARYHLARILLAKGERDRALEAFRTLVEELREAEGEDEEGEPRTGPSHPYVLAQAEIRLRELDPSSAPSAPSFGGGAGLPGGESLTPEQIEMIRQIMQKQGGGAPPAP
ncbi:MAG: tetratricopeptide repeat protein, partial [Sandaracinaceae bacterium]|nr:tetratricopeptide repeat protein [Sandaracinaceae bacterium]